MYTACNKCCKRLHIFISTKGVCDLYSAKGNVRDVMFLDFIEKHLLSLIKEEAQNIRTFNTFVVLSSFSSFPFP